MEAPLGADGDRQGVALEDSADPVGLKTGIAAAATAADLTKAGGRNLPISGDGKTATWACHACHTPLFPIQEEAL